MGTHVTDTTIEAKGLAAAPAVAGHGGREADQAASPSAGGEQANEVASAAPEASAPRPAGRRGKARAAESSGPTGGDDLHQVDASGPAVDPAVIAPNVEAILLSTDRPVPPSKIAEALGPAPASNPSATLVSREPAQPVVTASSIRTAVEHLNAAYAREGRSFRIEPVSGGLRIMTRPEYAEVLARFHGQRAHTRLSRAGIETLAIIAYRQPITRAEVESIRGVASGEILKTLMERRLVTITGRAEELGRPMLYGTTKQFLEVFGLASLKDLPPPEEFGLAPSAQA